jgi:hypothetical protein
MAIRAERGGKLVVEDGPIEGPELLRICQQIIRDDASLRISGHKTSSCAGCACGLAPKSVATI